MALSLVLLFVVMVTLFVYTVSGTRIEQKRQNLGTYQALQSHFLALGGIQHAMLKLRILPTESYEASALARGICPFYVSDTAPSPGQRHDEVMETFRSDLNSDDWPFDIAVGGDVDRWSYRVGRLSALSAYRRGNKMVHVVEIEALGMLPASRVNAYQSRIESVRKVVEVERGL